MASGIKTAKVSPAYLHSNSTCHTWPFSAVAELIDNAYDPDVSAKEMRIDVETINGKDCLIFKDNGNGMNYEKLHKMLSFGFSEKEAIGKFQPIGQYGNGFKSGSMRLGDDALVFTRCPQTTSVGFLSQTYLRETKAETVMVPIVTWKISGDSEKVMKATTENKDSLKAILQYSLLRTKDEIDRELDSLSRCGTKIIIYNLKRDTPTNYELDFQSDPTDIRYPETATLDTSTPDRPISVPKPEYRKSLMKYCSILYKKPRLKIFLRGKKVLCTLVESSLTKAMHDVYKPKDCTKRQGIRLTFGYTRDKDKDPEAYGLMLYHNNRLIKAYEKVGSQSRGNPESIGVLGIVEVNFLQPNNMKQDFIRDGKYTAFMAQAARKLNDYVNEQIYGKGASATESDEDGWRWVKCDKCDSFRRLPRDYKDELPDKWFCHMNPDSMYNRCEIPEEPHLNDEEEIKPYEKTFKKQQSDKKKKEKLENKAREQRTTGQREDSEDEEDTEDASFLELQTPDKHNAVEQTETADLTPVVRGMPQPSTSEGDVQGTVTPQQNKQTKRRSIDPKKLQEELEAGQELNQEGKYTEALKHFQKAKRMNPRDPYIHSLISECYASLNDFTKALAAVNESLEVDPNYIQGYLQRGKVHRSVQNSSAALQDFRRAVDLDPLNQEAQSAFRQCIDPEMDGVATALSLAIGSDGNHNHSGARIQFANKRRIGNSEESSTPHKVAKLVTTSTISVGISGNASGDSVIYRRKGKSPLKRTSQGSGGHTDGAGDRYLDSHGENIDSSEESAAVSSLKQELILCQKRLEEKDAELNKEKHETMTLRKQNGEQKEQLELLNTSLEQSEIRYQNAEKQVAKLSCERKVLQKMVDEAGQSLQRLEEDRLKEKKELNEVKSKLLSTLRNTDQETLNKLMKEKEEAIQKMNNFDRNADKMRQELSEEVARHEVAEASLQQKVKNLDDTVKTKEKELERFHISMDHLRQEFLRKSHELEENRVSKRDLQISILRLMKLLVPDYDYGEPEEIESTIQDFIEANESG